MLAAAVAVVVIAVAVAVVYARQLDLHTAHYVYCSLRHNQNFVWAVRPAVSDGPLLCTTFVIGCDCPESVDDRIAAMSSVHSRILRISVGQLFASPNCIGCAAG